MPIIFKDLYPTDKYEHFILELLFYTSISKGFYFNLKIYNLKVECNLTENVNYLNDGFPIKKNLDCKKIHYHNINMDKSISGLPSYKYMNSKNQVNQLNNQFIINKIYSDYINKTNYIILKGKLLFNLDIDITNLKIHFLSPKGTLICNLENSKSFFQAYIYCNSHRYLNYDLFVENQIIYSDSYNYSLILINSETLILCNYTNWIDLKPVSKVNINNITRSRNFPISRIIFIFSSFFKFALYIKELKIFSNLINIML
jgi:hypothetical protein